MFNSKKIKKYNLNLKNKLFYLFLSLSSLLISTVSFANPIDSLKQELINSSEEAKERIIYELASEYIKSTTINNPVSFEENNPLQLPEKKEIGMFNEQLGNIYYDQNQLEKAFSYYQKAIKIYENEGVELGIARVKQSLGLVYAELSNFAVSTSYFMDAIRIFKDNEEYSYEAEAIIELAKMLQELEQLNTAKELFLSARQTLENINDTTKIAEVYFYIAEIEKLEGDLDKSLVTHEKSVVFKQLSNDKKGLAASYLAIGNIYEQKKEFILADSYYKKALELYRQRGDKYGIAKMLNVIGNYFLTTGEFERARTNLTEAMIMAEYIGSSELLLDIYMNLSKLYEKEHLYDRAIYYYKNYINLKDSLFTKERYHKIAELKLSLDTLKKGEIIKELEQDSYLQSKVLKTQKRLLVAGGIAGVLFLVIVILLIMQGKRRKVLNQKLQIEKEKAEKADHLKSAFLANMSHEIRSPMNAIIGFSNVITDSFKLDPEMKEYMGYIKQSGTNLIHLVDDIIDIAKIEAGQLKIRKEEFDINEMLQKLLVTVQTGYEKKLSSKVSFHLNIPADIVNSVIVSDELRIKQVLTNFISNSVKFTEKGFIEFGYEQLPDNQLLFYTKDTGLGISEKDKELVFQRFGQVEDTYTRNTSGTGLGLAISKSIVELLDGEIWLDSAEGKGSTFYFKIPVTYATTKLATKQVVEKTPRSNFNWENNVFLVVEDDEMNFKVISSILKKTKAQLIRAENGHEAVQIALSNEHIDLVLMDIQLPVMNGYDASKKIKEHCNIPVIAITAYAMPGEKQKSIDAGCNDFITKPYNTNELINKISQLLD